MVHSQKSGAAWYSHAALPFNRGEYYKLSKRVFAPAVRRCTARHNRSNTFRPFTAVAKASEEVYHTRRRGSHKGRKDVDEKIFLCGLCVLLLWALQFLGISHHRAIVHRTARKVSATW